MIRLWCLLPVCLMLFPSCGKQRHDLLVQQPSVEEERAVDNHALADSLSSSWNRPWNTLTARAKIETESEGKTLNLQAVLRMKRDSLFWVSLSALMGVEAGRLLVSRDSLWMHNRLTGSFTAMKISESETLLGFPLRLETLQAMLMAALPEERWYKKMQLPSDSACRLKFIAPKMICETRSDTQNCTLTSVVLTLPAEQQSMEINFGGYDSLGSGLFPRMRTALLLRHNGPAVHVRMELSKIRIDEVEPEFPFSRRP